MKAVNNPRQEHFIHAPTEADFAIHQDHGHASAVLGQERRVGVDTDFLEGEAVPF